MMLNTKIGPCCRLMTLLLAAGVLMTSCSDAEVQEHREPKGVETVPDVADTGEASAERAQAELAPVVTPREIDVDQPWIVPDGWVFDANERPMRLATYQIPAEEMPIEVAITRFPSNVGGMLANMNRWRGQVGLGPLTERQLDGVIERHDNPGYEISLVHIEGPQLHMLAASIYEPAAGRTWFVRVTDRPDRVLSVKEQVFAFARTFGAD